MYLYDFHNQFDWLQKIEAITASNDSLERGYWEEFSLCVKASSCNLALRNSKATRESIRLWS